MMRIGSGKAGRSARMRGLCPKRYQSGMMDRRGRITGQGPGLLRRMLVQVGWGMQRREGRGKAVFEQLCGSRSRRKQAVVALARRSWSGAGRCCATAACGIRIPGPAPHRHSTDNELTRREAPS
jgi:transposase